MYIQADFTTQDLPSNASYRVGFTVNGLTLDTGYLTWGAGVSGTSSWYAYWGDFVATPGTNQVTVTVDPDHSVPETTYADNTMSFTFNAVSPAVGNLSYTVAQIRTAYGLNSIPDFGSATADGSGQTIALVDAVQRPKYHHGPRRLRRSDELDDELEPDAVPAVRARVVHLDCVQPVRHEHHAPDRRQRQSVACPPEDPTGDWEGEETLDVEWAHAIAPGAKIDLIECNGTGTSTTSSPARPPPPACLGYRWFR